MAKPTQKQIAFDSAVIACAAHMIRSEGVRIDVSVREMLWDFKPNYAHGDEGDLDELRLHNIIDANNKLIRF